MKYINDFSKIGDGNEEDAEQEVEWEHNMVDHVKGLDRTYEVLVGNERLNGFEWLSMASNADYLNITQLQRKNCFSSPHPRIGITFAVAGYWVYDARNP